MNFLIYWWHKIAFPFWKKVLVDAFVNLYSLSELINTNLYLFTSVHKLDIFWFSILSVFEHELTKLLIINNNKVPYNNMTVMIIYKKIAKFITFN